VVLSSRSHFTSFLYRDYSPLGSTSENHLLASFHTPLLFQDMAAALLLSGPRVEKYTGRNLLLLPLPFPSLFFPFLFPNPSLTGGVPPPPPASRFDRSLLDLFIFPPFYMKRVPALFSFLALRNHFRCVDNQQAGVFPTRKSSAPLSLT